MPKPTASIDLQMLTGDAARALEPALNCDAALLSPSTGIIDSHAYHAGAARRRRSCRRGMCLHTPLLRARPAPVESNSTPAATRR